MSMSDIVEHVLPRSRQVPTFCALEHIVHIKRRRVLERDEVPKQPGPPRFLSYHLLVAGVDVEGTVVVGYCDYYCR